MTEDKDCNCPETDDEYGDFPEPAREYCRAKKQLAANPNSKRAICVLKRKTANLVSFIQPKFFHFNNQFYYQEYNAILNETLEKVLDIICEEYAPDKAPLGTWINEIKPLRFMYKIKERYGRPQKDGSRSFTLKEEPRPSRPRSNSQLYDTLVRESLKRPLSLNQAKGDGDEKSTEEVEVLASNRLEGLERLIAIEEIENRLDSSTIEDVNRVIHDFYTEGITINYSDLDRKVEKSQERSGSLNTVFQQWINYLENDPDNFFREQVFKNYNKERCPECNYHVIIKEVLLPDLKLGVIVTEPYYKRQWRGKLKTLAERFNVADDTLYRVLTSKRDRQNIINYCQGFRLIFGWELFDLREKIEEDKDNFLRDDFIESHPLCNSQWLAQQLLPCFVEEPQSFKNLALLLSQQEPKYYNKLKAERIKKHWFKRTVPRLGQLAARLGDRL